MEVVAITTTTSSEAGHGGGEVEAICLPLDMLNGWLFGITTSRVRAELQSTIERYKRECYHVLYEAFRPRPIELADNDDAIFTALRDNALAQARHWDAFIEERRRLRLVQETVAAHEQELWEQSEQLRAHRAQIAELQEQQRRIGMELSGLTRLLPAPSAPIDAGQKARLQELVKELVASAQDRGLRLGQGRNDFAAVWGAFNQRFRIAKYAELPTEQFDEAEHWLLEWTRRVRDEE